MQAPHMAIALALLFAALSGSAQAEEANTGDYAYFILGVENVQYQETIGTSHSSVNGASPIISTGSLTVVNDRWDFSIDAISTFAAGTHMETWREDSQGQFLQNRFSFNGVSTNVLVQYKYTPNFRLVFGPGFSSNTFKRWDARIQNENINIFNGLYEEALAEIYLDAGVAFEKGRVHQDSWHVGARFTAGLPLWRYMENTAFPDAELSDTGGYRTSLEGTASYRVIKGLQVGLYGRYLHIFRDEGTVRWTDATGVLGTTGEQRVVTFPEATTDILAIGLQLLWDFDI